MTKRRRNALRAIDCKQQVEISRGINVVEKCKSYRKADDVCRRTRMGYK